MISQLFMAKSGMFQMQRKMQILANNVANAQTVGYKRRVAQMESMFPLILSGVISESDEAFDAPDNKRRRYVEYGQGVRMAEIQKKMEQGTIEITNQPLDFAIDGKGYFQVVLADGQIGYTRAGNFHIDAEGNVVDPNGHPLEPAINVPDNASEIVVNEQGEVYVYLDGDTTTSVEIGQVSLATFTAEGGLRDIGQNLFMATAASGEARLVNPTEDGAGSFVQRALEYSNVNIIEEMFDMMITQRTFEVIVKSIKSGDDMLKMGSDLKS